MDDSQISDAQLDRLVDGELAAEEYRRLLAAMDDEPGGWRRCALAFLESQALERDLGAVAAAISPVDSPVAEPHSTIRRPSRLWPLVLAMAGCFLLAFTIGSLVPGWRFGSSDEVAAPTAEPAHDADEQLPKTRDEAFDDGPPRSDVAEDTSTDQPIMTPDGNGPFREGSGNREPGNMMVIEFGDGRYEVPYYEMDEYESVRPGRDEPLLTEDLVRTLRRSGHELRQRHQVIPVPLNDGRRVLVPMEEAEIVPVSGRVYQ